MGALGGETFRKHHRPIAEAALSAHCSYRLLTAWLSLGMLCFSSWALFCAPCDEWYGLMFCAMSPEIGKIKYPAVQWSRKPKVRSKTTLLSRSCFIGRNSVHTRHNRFVARSCVGSRWSRLALALTWGGLRKFECSQVYYQFGKRSPASTAV